jgi:hypothetical protein
MLRISWFGISWLLVSKSGDLVAGTIIFFINPVNPLITTKRRFSGLKNIVFTLSVHNPGLTYRDEGITQYRLQES